MTAQSGIQCSLVSLANFPQSVRFLYEQCSEPNCHGPGWDPYFFYRRFSGGAPLISVMFWSRRHLPWVLLDPQSASFSICFVHFTMCAISCQMLTRPGSWEHTRLVLISLYSLFVQFPFRLEFNEPFPFLALWCPFFHPPPSPTILVLPRDHYLAGICLISLSLPFVLCESSRLGSRKHLWT